MQLFRYLPAAFLAFLFLTSTPVFAQQSEEKEATEKTEIIIITETIDENGNKNVNKTIHKGNFTKAEIEKIVQDESGEELDFDDANDIEVIIEKEGLHEKHERGYLGINIEDAAGHGVKITGIAEGSPAESAGMLEGDVIKSVNGEMVENSDALIQAVGSQGVGADVEVTYVREGAPSTVNVTLAERPESDIEKALKDVDEFKWVEKPAPDSKPRLGVYIESAENGVGITEVSENSLAESAGLKSGDIITSFNGIAVSSPDALIEAVQQSPTGEDVVVEIERNGEKMTKTVTFGKK
jgi:S1-C subfamily serine protease